MGWQARLPKDKKDEFVRTCNKCGNTGVKKRFISMNGRPLMFPFETRCKCVPIEEKSITVEIPAPPLSKEEVI